MNLRTQAATRQSKNSEHASYGVYNYLIKKGVIHPENQEEIISTFLLLMKYKTHSKRRDIENKAQAFFIQEKFKEFAKFTSEYQKIYLEAK